MSQRWNCLPDGARYADPKLAKSTIFKTSEERREKRRGSHIQMAKRNSVDSIPSLTPFSRALPLPPSLLPFHRKHEGCDKWVREQPKVR